MWRDLSVNAIMADREYIFVGAVEKIYWVTVLHEKLKIISCQRQGSFTNTFYSNLKTDQSTEL